MLQRGRFGRTAIQARDITNKKNLLLLVQLRWLAVIGQVLTILYVHFVLAIALPLAAMAAVLGFLVLLNIISLLRQSRRQAISNSELFLELMLDVGALTLQLYLSGGASNPFVSLYLLQVILGAVLVDAWSAWMLVLVTSGCFLFLTVSFRALDMPHAHGELLGLHIQGMFICHVLAATLLVFFVTRIQHNLKARDSRLAELRQRSVEEDHIVRMGLLASGAAHELGTPLSTLSVILSDWQRMPQLGADPEIAGEIAEMQSQLDRCKAIVSGILISSGDARGEGTIRTTATRFLDETVGEWRESRSPAVIDYSNLIEPDAAIISDTALKQVIFNILDNALEASPGWIGVVTGRQADTIVIAVSDAGPGFEPDMLETIGKPYRSSKGRPGGGLGLFLVVNVIRKLGGTVAAENGADGGACVTLALPLASLATGGHPEH
ncbi:sensor histidine kinase [Mesorhizobium sp. BR1-1-16]|uniref:ATP-binding protein n=1 Tax=Mesorhizobium sp. BR1-1-16 TaxID=2876653 RepID=UPI001CCD1019|nr:ATP-binding protein [Mesorhizobium sp. BR1-1-16]MBZ9938934.1 sensor histidine kinase [Mesorhizobium sp. BR1-1-16]